MNYHNYVSFTSTDDNTSVIALSSSTDVTYSCNIYDTILTTTAARDLPKHFNCKRCGAPNQVDKCEYCGSVYEKE